MPDDPPAPVAHRPAVPWSVLAAISAGGMLGSLARYGLGVTYPRSGNTFPWTTFVINVSGSLLIGVLMAILTQVGAPHRLARPFLGVGVLGGYTTFSTYAVDAVTLIDAGAARTALAYLVATVLAAPVACWAGTVLTRATLRAAHR